jgi:hypothetical protein
MGRKLDIAKDTIKGTAKDLTIVPRGAYNAIDGSKDDEMGEDYKAPSVDKDYAVKTAADHGDMNTIKSLVGEHPVESHFASTGPRHPLGRGLPSDHPAVK